jgi:hypothetical protein
MKATISHDWIFSGNQYFSFYLALKKKVKEGNIKKIFGKK